MVFVDYITRAPKKNMTPPHVWGRAFAQENYYYQNLMKVKQDSLDFLATRGMSDESARLPQLSSTEYDTEHKIGSTINRGHPLNEVIHYARNEANLARQRARREAISVPEDIHNLFVGGYVSDVSDVSDVSVADSGYSSQPPKKGNRGISAYSRF